MDPYSLLLAAVGLSMDACAVSIANGMTVHGLRIRHALGHSLCFGFFQAVMPVCGWLAGVRFSRLIAGVDHWIAFALLAGIGAKMIVEAVKQNDTAPRRDAVSLPQLLLLSISTSIDALAVGLGFAFLKVDILTAALVIGLVTFALSFLAAMSGKKLSNRTGEGMEIFGGAILMIVGAKILLTHV
jgi:putative Mn2+ efflux pump MntP